jgi:hypothetical protein
MAARRRWPTRASYDYESRLGSMGEFLDQPICSEYLIEKFVKSCLHTRGSDSLLIWDSLTIARGRVAIISRDWNILISQQPVCLLKTPSEILKPAQSRAGAGIVSVGRRGDELPPPQDSVGRYMARSARQFTCVVRHVTDTLRLTASTSLTHSRTHCTTIISCVVLLCIASCPLFLALRATAAVGGPKQRYEPWTLWR